MKKFDGAKLREIQTACGISNREIATALSVSEISVCNWRAGTLPRLKKLAGLIEFINDKVTKTNHLDGKNLPPINLDFFFEQGVRNENTTENIKENCPDGSEKTEEGSSSSTGK